MKDTDAEEGHVNFTLTSEEFNFFKKWLHEQMEIEESKSIDSLVKRASNLKRVAEELYPEEEFEVYVNENTKQVSFKVMNCEDEFQENTRTAQILIAVTDRLDSKSESTERRIYIK